MNKATNTCSAKAAASCYKLEFLAKIHFEQTTSCPVLASLFFDNESREEFRNESNDEFMVIYDL